MTKKVAYLDLLKAHEDSDQILKKISTVIQSGWYILGNQVANFESEFAEFCGAKYCIGVGNGLDALRLMLFAFNIGSGDEVIVPANTYIATILAITQVGAVPKLVDPNSETLNIDCEGVKKAISKKTKAILAVHLYGYPAPINELSLLAKKHNILLFDDCAQAHGTIVDDRRVGSIGNASAFSFFPTKNLGCLGDGGAITTDQPEIADKVRLLRNYGSANKYFNDLQGWNSRLDELQAAVLLARLEKLETQNQQRRLLAHKYHEELFHLPIKMLPYNSNAVYHIFPILTPDRNELEAFLKGKGIETIIHYPIPPHKQKCYNGIEWASYSFPITEKISQEELSLPLYPGLELKEQKYVIDMIKEFYG